MSSESFQVKVIEGITLESARNKANEIEQQLAQAGVLCLRINQKLSKEELLGLAGMFGGVKDPIGITKTGEQYQYSPIRQVIDSGWVPTEEEREKYDLNFGGLDEDRPVLFETFHCDDTFALDPAQYTVLQARALPASGGGPTYFMDMRDAYSRLPDELKRTLNQYTVHYAYDNTVDGTDPFPPRQPARDGGDRLVDVSHPIVRFHPIAKTFSLFMDLDRATHIDQLDGQAGRKLLSELQDNAEQHASKCHHDWQDYDVLIWDNASVQHRAGGNFKVGEERRFWRHLAGAGPVMGTNAAQEVIT